MTVVRVIWAALAAIVMSVGLLAGCNASATGGPLNAAAGIGASTATRGSAVSDPDGSSARAVGGPSTAAGGTLSAATAASSPSCGAKVTDVQDVERLINEPVGCPGGLNTFWHGELGDAWTAPRFVPYHDGEVPDDACGRQVNDPRQFADNALYCTLDDTVAYSVDFLDELAQVGGPTYPLFVLMHELSHRGDRIGGNLGVVSRAEENQADCFAGRQASAAHDAGRIAVSDAVQGALLFYSLGDTRGGWFSQEPASAPDAHGSPRQRAQAFAFGYLRDSSTCHKIGQSETGDVSF
ncbi:metalloprotease [Frankia sp. AiPs1]|uniref:metalloprotease n=1 Tax=Frankia sp. AiPs1 TaxID=573493 RepID=UPI0020449D5E|nr:metalloprotease [Frankia sp. AiPs1]MCM3925564.1 metalloprotease [Frankia sp. AiPs1]